jgi:transposase
MTFSGPSTVSLTLSPEERVLWETIRSELSERRRQKRQKYSLRSNREADLYIPMIVRHAGEQNSSSATRRSPKHGNPRLRAALVECAWRMVRFQPQYPPVKKRLSVLAKGARATGAQRKKAIVAVARHLAVDLWRVHTGRNTAVQLGLTI